MERESMSNKFKFVNESGLSNDEVELGKRVLDTCGQSVMTGAITLGKTLGVEPIKLFQFGITMLCVLATKKQKGELTL